MKCQHCGKSYPSKYYFKTPHCCTACFSQLNPEEQQRMMETDMPDPSHEAAQTWSIDGKSLICPICANETFWKRQTLMNTPGMTFFGIEWANRQAVNYVCNRCGYVFWFLRDK